jgi:hypothetical protein
VEYACAGLIPEIHVTLAGICTAFPIVTTLTPMATAAMTIRSLVDVIATGREIARSSVGDAHAKAMEDIGWLPGVYASYPLLLPRVHRLSRIAN